MPRVDQVLDAYRNNRPIEQRLTAVQIAVAEAAAELAWLRERQDDYKGDDLLEEARAITRRIRGLRRLVEVDVAEHRAGPPEGIDPASPAGQQVLQLLYDRIVGVAQDVLPVHADELVERFSQALADDPGIPWSPSLPPASPPTPPPEEPPEPPPIAAA